MIGSTIFFRVTSPVWIISHRPRVCCRFGLPRLFDSERETLDWSIEERHRRLWTGVAPLSPVLSRAGEARWLPRVKNFNKQDDEITLLKENIRNDCDEDIGNRNLLRWWVTSFIHKKQLTPSLDDRIQNLEFPFDKEGKQQEEILKEYGLKECEDASGSFVIKYLDIHIGSGDCVETKDIRKLKVVFDYYLYDRYHVIIKKSKSKSSHEERDLCNHEFGTGFNKGIRGMRAGGIRRFIVPEELLPKNKGYTVRGDAVFDVKLLKVYPSIACVARIGCFDGGVFPAEN